MKEIDPTQVETLRLSIDALVRAFKIREGDLLDDAVPKLNPSDVQAILFIETHPKCIANDLGRFLGVVPTTTSAIIDRLVRQDLAVRERTSENRRIVQLDLSEEGARIAQALRDQQTRHCKAMLANLDPGERRAFVAAMDKIGRGVG